MENTVIEENSNFEEFDNKSPLYSQIAIRGFSIFFCTFVGGILLVYNLRKSDQMKFIPHILIGSFLYTALPTIVFWNLDSPRSLTLLFNLIGGYVLSDVLMTRFIPTYKLHPKKSIWKTLLICLLLTLPFIALLIFTIFTNA